MVLPEATETVAVAAVGLTLHRMFVDVALSTGELLRGFRTAAVDMVPPAIRLYQMSLGYTLNLDGALHVTHNVQ